MGAPVRSLPLSQTPSRGDRTRAAVIDAATARFSAHGYEGTTTADVAADAGVAEGTVFLHFSNKAGLLIAVMNAYYAELSHDVEEVAARPGAPAERLRRLVDHWVERLDRDWPLTRVFAQQGRFHAHDEIAAAFLDNNRRITRIVGGVIEDLKAAGAIRADIPTRLLRDAIFGTAEHVQIGRIETGRPRSLKPVGGQLLDLLLHGATPPAPSATEAADSTGDEPSLASLAAKLDAVLEQVQAPGAP